MIRKRLLQTAGAILIGIAVITFVLCNHSEAYNKPWDQGHQCCEAKKGSGNWGRYDYDGVFQGNFTPKECCELLCKICPVYARTGELQETYTDLTVPGVGPSLTLTRTYLSQNWSSSLLGHGWVFNFGRRMIIIRNKAGEKVVGIIQNTGEKNFFKENVDGSLELLADYGVTYDLIKNPDGTYTIGELSGKRYELKSDGKINQIIDKNGNVMQFTYDAVGCLSRITNASGNYVDFQLGPNGKIASATDNMGRTINYAYDANGNLISVTDPMGNTTQYSYNAQNLLTQVTDARGNVVFTAGYNTNEPPQVASFMEKGENYTISYFDDRTEKTDSHSNKWTYYFTDLGIIEKVVDPLGYVSQQQPNKVTATSLEWEDDANGNRTTFTYDADGNMTSKTDPLSNTWTYTYVAGTDWLETETNPLAVVTKYEYDADGNMTKMIRDFGGALQISATYTYNSEGNRTSVTDPLGPTTSYEYDAEGNLTKVTDALGNVMTYTYDSRGSKLTETDANGHTTTYTYDLMGRLLTVTDALGNTTTFGYDADGNMVAMQLPNGGNTAYTYDAYNRMTQITNPLGNSKTNTYDHNDQLVSKSDANGNTTQYGHDALGRRTSVTDAEGHTTQFGYDAIGNRNSVTDANGNTTTFTYDALNRLVQKTYSDGTSYTYTYDTLSRRITQTDPNGDTINYSYDRLNRLVQKTNPDTSTADFTYDLAGRMLTGSNPDSGLSYTYDDLGRVTQVIQNGKQIQYSYDAAGNRVTMTTPEGEVVSYSYNAGNQMTRLQLSLSSGKGIDYSCDSLGRVVRKDYSGGCCSTYVFDLAGKLTQLSHLKGDGSEIYTQTNTFDNVGNILSKTTGLGLTTYTYDKTYQLTSATHPTMPQETFTYDPVHNRLTSTDHNNWNYNNRNELTDYDGTTFGYEANGNTVTKTDGSGVTQYSYDYENRLKRTNFPDASYGVYKYDVKGRRIEKDVDGNVTTFLYYGSQLLAEYNSLGSLTRNYFYGYDSYNPLLLKENGSVYFYLKDHIGTPKRLIDENGSIVWTGKYKSFGKLTVSVATIENNIGFPGQYLDQVSKEYYNLHRYYNPDVGRYTQPDPAGLISSTVNLYLYGYNNPITKIDPFGLWVLCGGFSGEVKIKVGVNITIYLCTDHDGDVLFKLCGGGGVGAGAFIKVGEFDPWGDIELDGFALTGELSGSAGAAFFAGVEGGGSISFDLYNFGRLWYLCRDFMGALSNSVSGGPSGAIIAGFGASIGANLSGCAKYGWQ